MQAEQSVWITGASSGIGLSTATLLAQKGYQVFTTARNTQALNDLAKQYPNVTPFPADLTCEKDLNELKAALHDVALDIAIINAGDCTYMENHQLDMEAMRQVFEINVFASAACIDIALNSFENLANTKPGSRGHLIGVSSLSVLLPFTQAEYYASSKAAFSYYLNSLAIDLGQKPIDISVVYPGFVQTPLTDKNNFPMPFIISSEKAANHLEKVILSRPRSYYFPRIFSFLLKFFRFVPCIWRAIHKPLAQ